MGNDPFLLINLKDSKELGQVMSSSTARLLLDALTDATKGLSESELAKKVSLPLSTVHYNLQALKKARLVKTDEFHYSPKGKEVLHYTLANKLIIIAPDQSTHWKDKLKSLIPGFGLLAVGSVIIEWMQRASSNGSMILERGASLKTAEVTQELVQAAPFATDSVAEATMMAPLAVEATRPFLSAFTLYFIIGGLAMLLTLLILRWRNE